MAADVITSSAARKSAFKSSPADVISLARRAGRERNEISRRIGLAGQPPTFVKSFSFNEIAVAMRGVQSASVRKKLFGSLV